MLKHGVTCQCIRHQSRNKGGSLIEVVEISTTRSSSTTSSSTTRSSTKI